MTMLQLALATDANMVDPALVMLGSTLERSRRRARVHFLGYSLSEAARARVQALCERYQAELVYHALNDEMFAGGVQRDPNISLVTLARMYLPQLASGRVLYLDCDMMALGDVGEIYDIDLNGALIGAVRDFWVLHRLQKEGKQSQRLDGHREVMQDSPLEDYFNAGLLLMDCDAIRAVPGLPARMLDLSQASQYRLFDQDYLNILFRGQVRFLPLAWNSVWGRDRLHAKVLKRLSQLPDEEKTPTKARIVHFTGPHKPWKPLRISALTRGRVPITLRYRLLSRRILAGLPGTRPGAG